MARVRSLLVVFGALALVLATALPATAATPDTTAAVSYLASQQAPGADPSLGSGSWDTDTGFGLSEFNTSEAVLAIAEAAQSGPSWNPTEARAAVEAMVNGDGLDPLDFLDDWAEAGLDPSGAGKFLLLVALPLDDGAPGFAPTAWDPAGDGTPVDLVGALDGGCGDDPADYGFFGQTAVAMQAKAAMCGTAGPASVATVRAAQQADGGWSFDGDPSGATEADVDTTSLAILALVAGGAGQDDPAVVAGLAFLAERQTDSGWWDAFGSASPDSTSRATLAIAAAGFDPAAPAWRDTVLPSAAGTPYVSPDDALGALQQPDGSIVGPGTFSAVYATAQAVQGVERSWLPVKVAAPVAPPPPAPGPDEVGDDALGDEALDPDSSGDEVGAAQEAPATLPRTGLSPLPLAVVAAACLATGAFLLARPRMMRA